MLPYFRLLTRSRALRAHRGCATDLIASTAQIVNNVVSTGCTCTPLEAEARESEATAFRAPRNRERYALATGLTMGNNEESS